MKYSILYSSYDGISGNLGQSQIIPYLLYLSKFYNITVLSLEKSENYKNLSFIENSFKENKIKWVKHKYHYKIKLFNIIKIIILNFFLFFLELKNNYSIVHIRGFPSFFLVFYLFVTIKKNNF